MENRDRRVSAWWVVAILVAGMAVIAKSDAQETVIGDGPCAGRSSACSDQNVLVEGVTVGGDKHDALGLGFSSPSFGAAIAQCVATEAGNYLFGAYGRQKVVVNYWCMGSSLRQLGLYDMSARVWCEKTDLGDLYPSIGECINAASTPPQSARDEPVEVSQVVDELEELHAAEIEEQLMLLADMQAKIMNLETELDRAQPPQTIIQQVPALSDEQRQALKGLKDETVVQR